MTFPKASACPGSTRPWVQIPVPQNTKFITNNAGGEMADVNKVQWDRSWVWSWLCAWKYSLSYIVTEIPATLWHGDKEPSSSAGNRLSPSAREWSFLRAGAVSTYGDTPPMSPERLQTLTCKALL
jgi:hypothetical protein